MTDYEIRAMLRAATAERILSGWQGPHVPNRSYCLTTQETGAAEESLEFVVGYCQMLRLLGLEPLYRESEPKVLRT